MAVIVAIPRVLREHLTDEGAEALVSLLNETKEKSKQDIIQLVEERFERRLSEEIGKLRIEMHTLRGDHQMDVYLLDWAICLHCRRPDGYPVRLF